jgi:hypothetical protein
VKQKNIVSIQLRGSKNHWQKYLLTLGSSDVDDGAVVLENINLLNALDIRQGHLLQNAAQLLVICTDKRVGIKF